ncbi:MAG: bifunctional hydroxymethylpyrimidine kinase/phosphomethylpyrimidine kinase, partial [Alphaproteobacteria bacterium]|nr:bifunctional hydroxymethylpyrimidine kinase/phosphomethylpyrimidine kinase [Alphaproteobacteria bacterium]
MIPNVLSIAGSDPSGGAGIQADLKTFSALGCYGMAALTALTAQNTKGVAAVHAVPPEFLYSQLQEIFVDINVGAVKIGMAGTDDSIGVIVEILQHHKPPHVVLDPVMIAQSGDSLLSPKAMTALQEKLIPLASLITPNIPEAQALLGGHPSDDPETLARALHDTGNECVLVKGGHGAGDASRDVLMAYGSFYDYEAARIDTKNNHGTGCTLSAAIACFLARGHDMPDAVGEAKAYITGALSASDLLDVGGGAG